MSPDCGLLATFTRRIILWGWEEGSHSYSVEKRTEPAIEFTGGRGRSEITDIDVRKYFTKEGAIRFKCLRELRKKEI